MNKKEYIKPSMEVVETALQQILCGSGKSIHMDDPLPPGSSMAPGLFDGDEWDF